MKNIVKIDTEMCERIIADELGIDRDRIEVTDIHAQSGCCAQGKNGYVETNAEIKSLSGIVDISLKARWEV